MSFLSWLTGRSEKESDVYANYDKVDSVVQEIKSIGTNQVETARTEINSAITALNNVNGVAQYVGQVKASGYDSVFDSIATSISQIGEQLQNKAESIKTYEDAHGYEKILSTIAMTGAKLGEGILSVAEDIGDGVVSIAGWLAPEDSDLEKACESFVKKNWSHDAFNFYYNKDFAKKSAFTEDSAIAGGLKIVGSTAGYLALGGIVSGAAVPLANSSKGVIKAAGTFLNSTTKVNTLTAALSGMGSGTEAGLKSGLSMDEAAAGGAKQAAIQGTLAYAGGKLGERSAKNSAIKEQEKIIKNADDILANKEGIASAKSDVIKARKAYQQAISDGADDATKAALKTKYTTAQDALEKVTNGKPNINLEAVEQTKNNAQKAIENINSGKVKFQGYNDKISKAAREKVEDLSNRVAYNYKFQGQGALQSVKNVAEEGAKNTFKTVQARTNQVAYDVQTATVSDTWNAVKKGFKDLKPTITKTVVPAAVNAIKNPTNITTVANATGREYMDSKGAAQFKKTSAARTIVGTPDDGTIQITTDEPERIKKTPSVGGNNDNTGGGNTGGGNTGGGNTGGGSTGGGNTGGGSTGGNYEDSSVQFRSNVDKDADKKATNDDKKSEKPSNTTTNANKSEKPSNTTTDANKSEKPSNTTTDANKSEKPSNTTTNTVTTPSSTNTGTTTTTTGGSTTGSGTFHTGGGYTGTGGYTENNTTLPTDATTETTTSGLDDIKDTLTDGTTSIEDVIKGSKYTKIPSTPSPVTTSPSSGGASAVIPIAAGLSAAAAAGIGAKAYMDRKKNNDNGEDEDEFDTDEWSGDDSVDIQYDDSSDNENYLDADDDYSYQTEDSSEKYDARSSDELADLQ